MVAMSFSRSRHATITWGKFTIQNLVITRVALIANSSVVQFPSFRMLSIKRNNSVDYQVEANAIIIGNLQWTFPLKIFSCRRPRQQCVTSDKSWRGQSEWKRKWHLQKFVPSVGQCLFLWHLSVSRGQSWANHLVLKKDFFTNWANYRSYIHFPSSPRGLSGLETYVWSIWSWIASWWGLNRCRPTGDGCIRRIISYQATRYSAVSHLECQRYLTRKPGSIARVNNWYVHCSPFPVPLPALSTHAKNFRELKHQDGRRRRQRKWNN